MKTDGQNNLLESVWKAS